ncbi:MAG: RIP metalloprotease RseP [Gammaproteobacteria bacterium]
MIAFLQATGAFILVLGVLITFHEFGHYWVARRCGVKILRFSIGFGRPLWKRTFGKDKTELVVASLPLGGYVKMLDEREGEVPEAEKHRAFNNQSLPVRIAVVSAGPLFNFLFAVLAYWAVYMVGITGLKPVIGGVSPDSTAMRAGLQPGQVVLRVDKRRTPTWSAVADATIDKLLGGGNATFSVQNKDGSEENVIVNLSSYSIDDMAQGRLLEKLGISPKVPVYPAVIGRVSAGGAAEAAGLRPGDKVLSAGGKAVSGWGDWVGVIRSHPDLPLPLKVQRDGETVNVTITPKAVKGDDGKTIGFIGAAAKRGLKIDKSLMAVVSYGPLAALAKGGAKTGDMSLMTLRILGKMVTGQASVKNLSGPISIAQYAGQTASLGLAAFLGFMAVVSVSLAVLNLLPIPVLDGGHLMYYLIEFVKGSPVPESVQLVGQQVGIAVLLGLMSIAFYNDILRLIG